MAMLSSGYGAHKPNLFARTVLSVTESLPDNWLGMRVAMAFRRLVMMRLRDDRPLDVVRWGLRLRLYPCRNGCEKMLLFTPQMYERPELAALSRAIHRAARPFVFVDIGANVGLFSFFVAAHAGRDATILAIEPDPENVRRFRFNCAANPQLRIRLLQIALGASFGAVELLPDLRDRGGTRTAAAAGNAAGAMLAECAPLLQTLVDGKIERIDALKIDVEGSEASILVPFFRDAGEPLLPRLLIIEDSDWRNGLMESLVRRGYRIIDRTRLNLIMTREPEA